MRVGIIGNDRISDFGFMQIEWRSSILKQQRNFREDLLRGVAIGKLSNPEIRWETKTANAGLDILMLNNKPRMSFDAYQRKLKIFLLMRKFLD